MRKLDDWRVEGAGSSYVRNRYNSKNSGEAVDLSNDKKGGDMSISRRNRGVKLGVSSRDTKGENKLTAKDFGMGGRGANALNKLSGGSYSSSDENPFERKVDQGQRNTTSNGVAEEIIWAEEFIREAACDEFRLALTPQQTDKMSQLFRAKNSGSVREIVEIFEWFALEFHDFKSMFPLNSVFMFAVVGKYHNPDKYISVNKERIAEEALMSITAFEGVVTTLSSTNNTMFAIPDSCRSALDELFRAVKSSPYTDVVLPLAKRAFEIMKDRMYGNQTYKGHIDALEKTLNEMERGSGRGRMNGRRRGSLGASRINARDRDTGKISSSDLGLDNNTARTYDYRSGEPEKYSRSYYYKSSRDDEDDASFLNSLRNKTEKSDRYNNRVEDSIRKNESVLLSVGSARR